MWEQNIGQARTAKPRTITDVVKDQLKLLLDKIWGLYCTKLIAATEILTAPL